MSVGERPLGDEAGLRRPEPLHTAALFLPLHEELMSLLRGFSPEDWERPTCAGRWRVRDVAAHLLDTQLRKLSVQRDGHRLSPPDLAPVGALLSWLNALNAEWVEAAGRLSPRVLVDLLSSSGPQVAAYVEGLDPSAPAPFAVAWAGESQSQNWFDTGREYTEWWHHQQQIREAVKAPLLLERRFLHPVLAISMPALRVAYAAVDAPRGTAVTLVVEGDAGGSWTVRREDTGWSLHEGSPAAPHARAVVDPDTAWRMFFKAITPAEARTRARIEGDAALAAPALGALAVMA